jgi:hypothetical protein
MKTTAIALLLCAICSLQTRAQECSNRITSGKYVVVCDGFITLAPNTSLLPAKGLAVATADRDGNWSGGGTISVGGQVLQQSVAGSARLLQDCTGTITYQQTINGEPAPPLDLTFVVSERGDVIDGLVTDAGTVFSCRLKRMGD